MELPPWVHEAIRQLTPPFTGKVVIELELYKGGVTKIEIGGMVRVKPPADSVQPKTGGIESSGSKPSM